jgi:fatty-acyl-CoA synthase
MKLAESHYPADLNQPILEQTIGDALMETVQLAPERVALVEGVHDPALRRQWTYRELLSISTRAAKALLQEFLPGDRIAVWAPNIPEWIFLQYGAALAGMTLVTINPTLRKREMEYILRQSRSCGLFYQRAYRDNAMEEAVRAVESGLEALRFTVSFDGWDDFVAAAVDATPLPLLRPGDLAMIQYTSGTTGFPKGAMLQHRGLVNNARLSMHRLEMNEESVFVSPMPLFHTGGSVVCVIGSMTSRARFVMASEFDPALMLELIESQQATHTHGVPTMLIALMEHPDYTPAKLASLKSVFSGGSTVPVELVRRIEKQLGANFSIMYGQTETSPVITMTHLDDSPEDKGGTIGTPLPQTEVRIVDPDSGSTLPCGEIGELCTRGFLIMEAYFEMPEATAETIDEDGWLHTGDLCAMDERGYCTIEGRLKDMVIRGGENIYPREIEELLFTHPDVVQAAVVGIPDEKWGEQLAAFLQLREGSDISSGVLIDFLEGDLARHKTPKLWYRVDGFPLTASGKIRKFALRDSYLEGQSSQLSISKMP